MSDENLTKFDRAVRRFDAANAEDPNKETAEGKEWPKELLYARRMSEWLARVAPDASEALRLAARAQHIRRWEIPRKSYPMGRAGYYQWRTRLYGFHAETAGKILEEAGYDTAAISRVQELLRKKNLRTDPEAQALEDTACLVFLENGFAEFAQKHDEEKLIAILQKTWGKMSPCGRELALGLDLSDEAKVLVEKALR